MENIAEAKILLVDDREENLLALETILRCENYQFVKARSGRQALKCLLDDQDFYLIIMDVVMPDMDGFETAELIYNREKLKNIPIIFLTAMDIEENIYKGYESGAIDYIGKPVIPAILRAKVRAFVELSQKNKRLLAQEEKLRTINKNLEREIHERKLSEEKIKALNKDLEERLAELQSLDAFAGSVSHDLMSPLNNISGLTRILANQYSQQLDEGGKKMVGLIQESSQKMSKLVKNLLLFSRQANAELIKDELDMNDMVGGVLREIESYRSVEGISIRVQELPKALCDGNMVKQLWINFITNAIKYSQKMEQPSIEIGSFQEDQTAVYFVRDNGVGFDMKDYDKLFGPFKRLHNASDYEGTGIGLTIVKRIIERHGGKVWAESTPGKGATFYFTLEKPKPPNCCMLYKECLLHLY
ncbi:sensor histidine kinase, partial [Cesiribacter andamanensis]|uniref:sensor histidine kinase n=1 Tax=Cesiribacter andamanensis TaxID=649507 RepID=UPI001378C6A9